MLRILSVLVLFGCSDAKKVMQKDPLVVPVVFNKMPPREKKSFTHPAPDGQASRNVRAK